MIGQGKKHGQSVLEFTSLIVVILLTFLIFQKYVVRAFSGRWKGIGDSFGQGRVYDHEHTTECGYYPPADVWFDRKCYDANCEDDCLHIGATEVACTNCVTTVCQEDLCDE